MLRDLKMIFVHAAVKTSARVFQTKIGIAVKTFQMQGVKLLLRNI